MWRQGKRRFFGGSLNKAGDLTHPRGIQVGRKSNYAASSRLALAVICDAKIHGIRHRPWLTGLLARRPTKIAAIALANKLARNQASFEGRADVF
jgi:hypothetical protein